MVCLTPNGQKIIRKLSFWTKTPEKVQLVLLDISEPELYLNLKYKKKSYRVNLFVLFFFKALKIDLLRSKLANRGNLLFPFSFVEIDTIGKFNLVFQEKKTTSLPIMHGYCVVSSSRFARIDNELGSRFIRRRILQL